MKPLAWFSFSLVKTQMYAAPNILSTILPLLKKRIFGKTSESKFNSRFSETSLPIVINLILPLK